MSNFNKWSDRMQERQLSNDPVHGVLIISRNKDNANIPNFVERREPFLTTWPIDDPRLHQKFRAFTEKGCFGELSRLYVSVNARDQNKIRAALQHFLIDHPDTNMAALPGLVTRLAMNREFATEKKRLFDFDTQDISILTTFIKDLIERGADPATIHNQKTPHGYAVVINRGVDLRGLVDTQPDITQKQKRDQGPWRYPPELVTYKIDDMLLVDWNRNPYEPRKE